MRIVIFTTGTGVGGAEKQVVTLAAALRQRGHEMRIISLVEVGDTGKRARAEGLHVESLGMRPGWPDAAAFVRAVRLLRRVAPDALICFMYHANLLGSAAGRVAGVPVVVTSIRNERFGGRLRDRLQRASDMLSHAVVTNSRAAAESLLRRGVVRDGHVHIIPNAVDPESMRVSSQERDLVRNELKVGEDRFLWLAVGRLEPAKDYYTLLHAAAQLAERKLPFRMVIAGSGSLQAKLKANVREHQLEEHVSFLGSRTDVARLQAAADALVLSSAWEGLPNAVMEGMSAGNPVVATRVGGVAELVEEGRSGLLVEPGRPEDLSAAMERLMALPAEIRRRMGEAGREHVTNNFSVHRVLASWERLLEDLLAARRPQTAAGTGGQPTLARSIGSVGSSGEPPPSV